MFFDYVASLNIKWYELQVNDHMVTSMEGWKRSTDYFSSKYYAEDKFGRNSLK
jgi:hypothetical protein